MLTVKAAINHTGVTVAPSGGLENANRTPEKYAADVTVEEMTDDAGFNSSLLFSFCCRYEIFIGQLDV